MKLHFTLLGLCAATLCAVIAAMLVYRPNPVEPSSAETRQVYQVKGQVRSLEGDGETIHIAHEDIPGFMPAMEMPFTVKSPELLRGLAPGDVVKFELIVTKDDSWISRIEKTTEPLVVRPPIRDVPAAEASAEPARLEVGQKVPDFLLTDQRGRPIRLSDFRGKAVVLTFIYTRCPLPNFCPLMLKNFAVLQERFRQEFPGQTRLLSISFDPEFDTPETLARYAAQYQPDEKAWSFATGTRAEVDFVSNLFGLIREPADGFINHDLRTALISPDGKLVHLWRSNVWTPEEVVQRVGETLQPRVAAARAR